MPTKIRYDLDIDIIGVSDEEIRNFKGCKNGYCGHHTKQVGSENKYNVLLRTPAGLIFNATISFTRQHDVLSAAPLHEVVMVTSNQTRASVFARLRGLIMRLYQLARSSVRLRG